MLRLPYALYTAAQTRELDRLAIADYGLPGVILMACAAKAAYEVLLGRWPGAHRIIVVCGPGNNGGDGLVLAHLALEAGLEVQVVLMGEAARIQGDARSALETLRAAGGDVTPFVARAQVCADVIVDALFGTGLDRDVTGLAYETIQWMNDAGVPVLALDLPSGLHADTGRILGAAVRAEATVSFMGLKQGMYTGEGFDHCGEVYYSNLGVSAGCLARVTPAAERIPDMLRSDLLMPRARGAHKGRYGHVLVVGGDHGMSGAVRLAGEAAARAGAGLVSVATRSAHAAVLNAGRPELMCHVVEEPADLAPLLARATVVAVGPGLGQQAWGAGIMQMLSTQKMPMVVDADALNVLARTPARRDNWILTPHPREAARLLGSTSSAIQADRYASVRDLQHRYGGSCVLKGAGTLVWSGTGPVAVCDAGNPGMASGGMGDVLTGVIAGLVAQGLGLANAARLGVYLHARAGDLAAAERGERGLLASDLMPHVQRLANPVGH